MLVSYQQTLWTMDADGPALSNSTSATSLIGTTIPKLTLPTNFFDKIGQKIRLKAHGRISTVVASPGTLTLDIRFGAVIVATGGTMVLSTTAKTNVSWNLEWDLTIRAKGQSTTANLMHQGEWTSEAAGATTVAGEAKTIMLPQSAPAVGTGFDSSATQSVDLFGTWSSASSSNSILVHQCEIVSLN
jgi:hypothetical protein